MPLHIVTFLLKPDASFTINFASRLISVEDAKGEIPVEHHLTSAFDGQSSPQKKEM